MPPAAIRSPLSAAAKRRERSPVAAFAPVKWRPVAMAKHSGARDVFRKTMLSLLAQMRANGPGALAGRDIEYLHQLRVAIRRARAILSLYSGLLHPASRRSAVLELRWLGRALGPARDSDVFLNDIWPSLRAALGNDPLTGALDRRWQTERRRHARAAHRALAGPRYRKLMSWLQQWIAQSASRDLRAVPIFAGGDPPAREFGRQELRSRTERVRMRGDSLSTLDVSALHGLRVEIKKLRYMVEVLGPVYKRTRVKKLLAALSRVQDTLGDVNDIEVASEKLDAVLSEYRRADTARHRERFENWRTLRSKGLKRKLRETWRAYDRVKSLW